MEADAAARVSLAPERVAEMVERGEAHVIDVRERREWDVGRVPGARNIEIDDIPQHADSIDRGAAVVLVCRSGERSEIVAAAFRESGWDAFNMEGGLAAWANHGLPLEPDGGQVAKR